MNYKLLNIILLALVVMLSALLILSFRNFLPQKPNILLPYEGYKFFTPKYYFGVDVDMSQLLPGSKYYIVNNKGEDLIDIAAKLGINTFRIMNYTTGSKYSYTKQEWDIVLRKMNSSGIKAIILNESPSNQSSLDHVKSYILASDVCNNPDVFAIDLSNEPNLSTSNLTMFATEAQLVKQKCPDTMVTIGGWKVDTFRKDASGKEVYDWNNPKDSSLIKNIVDFYALHIYGFDRKQLLGYPDPYTFTINFLNTVKQYGGNKPILIEEFGAGNGQALTDQTTLGSKELQENAYEGVLQAAYDQHIIGATSYIFYPRSTHPEGWNIINDHGNNIFPAAYTFKQFTSLTTPKANTSQLLPLVSRDVILSNKDNNTQIHVHPKDIIGIHLTIDPKGQYVVQTDTNSLSMTEPLVIGWDPGTYDMVFHATQIGSETIAVLNNKTAIFRVAIIVN